MGRKHRKGTKARPSNKPLSIMSQEQRARLWKEKREAEEKKALEKKKGAAKGLKELLKAPDPKEEFYQAHPWLRPQEEGTRRTYHVPKGTVCSVAKYDSEEWQEYTTKKAHYFFAFQRYVEKGEVSFYEFHKDDWKMLVLCKRTEIRETHPEPY